MRTALDVLGARVIPRVRHQTKTLSRKFELGVEREPIELTRSA